MPIEMWWWVKPLFETGIINLFLFGVSCCFIGGSKFWDGVALVLLLLAIAPILLSFGCAAIWFFANILVVIWR